MQEIRIQLEIADFQDKYRNLVSDESFYSSPEFYKAYTNYRKSKNGDIDPLDIIPNTLGRAAHDVLLHSVFRKSIEKITDNAMRQVAKDTGGIYQG